LYDAAQDFSQGIIDMNTLISETKNASLAIVIFGVTGDLTRRKLLPALYELMKAEKLPEKLYLIGFARRDWNDEFLREKLKSGIDEYARSKPIEDEIVERLLSRTHYVQSTFEELQGYQ
jgi:glucose-6-phosphate 1-dehydrogenase